MTPATKVFYILAFAYMALCTVLVTGGVVGGLTVNVSSPVRSGCAAAFVVVVVVVCIIREVRDGP